MFRRIVRRVMPDFQALIEAGNAARARELRALLEPAGAGRYAYLAAIGVDDVHRHAFEAAFDAVDLAAMRGFSWSDPDNDGLIAYAIVLEGVPTLALVRDNIASDRPLELLRTITIDSGKSKTLARAIERSDWLKL